MDYKNRKQIFSLRKFKGLGLASAVIASMFFAQGVSAEVVANPNGTTTISNDKASIVVESNHYKESQDKTASELYTEGSYAPDKETTGADTKQVESKTIIKYETENHDTLETDKEISSTETVSQTWKQSGVSGKAITGTDTKPTVNSDLEKKDTIEKDGTKYKYVRTETSKADNSTLSEEHFNDVTTKATNVGLHKEDGSINYSNIPNGSRVWLLEEKEDGSYGKYVLVDNATGLDDAKVSELAKTATKTFSKAEVDSLGGLKSTDTILVYETNTYAAKKNTELKRGYRFQYNQTSNGENLHKGIIDEIFAVGLDGLEKKVDGYYYKGIRVPTIEDFKGEWRANQDNPYKSTTEDSVVTTPATYYEVLTDFMSKHPESHILDNRVGEIFWDGSSEEIYSIIPTITRWALDKFEKMYNISSTTTSFTDKFLSSKADAGRPTELTKYSYAPILEPNTDPSVFINATLDADFEKAAKDFYSLTYSPEHVRAIRNIYTVKERMYGRTSPDLFNGKLDSDVTLEEYLNGLSRAGVFYPAGDQSVDESALKVARAHPEWRTLHIHQIVEGAVTENDDNMDYIAGASTNLDTNSPGLVTENTETFTYHDVITPLRAYRLNAGENVVRHIYKEVPKGSVIATYRDEAGNDLIDAKQVKTNESEGTAYNTQSETIAPRVTTETTPEGFTKTITKTYELISEPQNKNGEVIGNQTITVPYVYRVTTDTVINGSVIATYKDTDGNVLAPQEAIKTNVSPNETYTTNSKEIPSTTETVTTPDGLTKTITTSYELVSEPQNKNGAVEGNKTIVVPYVYRKIVNEVTNGSVIATYKDTEGNVLAPQESIKTNVVPNEAYTTNSKEIPSTSEITTTPEGLTKTITVSYELVSEPQNKNGAVEGGKTIVVPYVYRKIVNEVTNGSVIATYKDTEGNELAPQEEIKTNVAPNEAYTTNGKEIPVKTITEVLEDGSTKTTTITYELVENPTNKDGEVQGGKTITVPYVYNKKVTEVITPKPQPEKPKEDKPKEDKPKEETPKETPKTNEKPKEVPKTEEPKPKETPKVEEPKETPKPKDEPKETPKEDEKPKGNTPKVEQPKETPKDNPKNEKPNVPIREEQPKSKEIPQAEKPKEDNSKETPKKEANPVSEPVKSQGQKTELPNTGAKQDSTGVLGLISLLLSGGLLSLKRRKNAE